jgi:hypothetical protein
VLEHGDITQFTLEIKGLKNLVLYLINREFLKPFSSRNRAS